jgi:ABC-type microcin C transport system permease subunit YejB
VNYSFLTIFKLFSLKNYPQIAQNRQKAPYKQVGKNVKNMRHYRFGGKKWRENVYFQLIRNQLPVSRFIDAFIALISYIEGDINLIEGLEVKFGGL